MVVTDKRWNRMWELHSKKPGPSIYAEKCYNYFENKSKNTLLYLGCGYGRDSVYFSKKCDKVVALDFSKFAIDYLNKKLEEEKIENVDTLCCDMREMKFKENYFDIIYASLSLHYFDDETTKKIFSNLHKILKPGGLLFARCKSTKDQLFGKGEKIDEHTYVDEYPRHFFDEKNIREVSSDFEIVNLEEYSEEQEFYTGEVFVSSYIEIIAKK